MSASKRRGNYSNRCEDFRTENGSSQGQNLALAVLHVSYSLDSGVLGSEVGSYLRLIDFVYHSQLLASE